MFVLPNNVYPSVHVEDPAPAPKKAAPVSRRTRLRAWRLPLFAALATLLIAVVLFLWVWPRLGRKAERLKDTVAPARTEFDRFTRDGERDLADGSFALALEKFEAALKLRRAHPGLFDAGEDRQHLNQSYWQSYLLAKKLRPSLADVLHEANEYDKDDAWNAQFKQDYRGKWVVFDDQVYRDPRGQPVLLHDGEIRYKRPDSRVEWHARVDLDDLRLLEKLPLRDRVNAQRWIFGARLASFTRDGDDWVIRFDPDSGVLLTDGNAVRAWRPALKDDAALPEVLKRQAEQQVHVPEP